MIIVGAGMAGCLAGVLNPQAKILESHPEFIQNHDAVLRFRDSKVSTQTGIPFKKVTVRKGIYTGQGHLVDVDIYLANAYSVKVTGQLSDRSIWNMEPVERYVAPSNFHEILADMCNSRIYYGTPFEPNMIIAEGVVDPIISTIPMPIMAGLLNMVVPDEIDFSHRRIEVNRYKITNCDLHQTVYYPMPDCPAYRATITGEDFIIESIGPLDYEGLAYVCHPFGFTEEILEPVKEHHAQKYGKIRDIDDKWRKVFMYKLTQKYNIYSLGRFATWRNILLDDVLDDIFKIREMMNHSTYDFIKEIPWK